jgi:hypothetical protein
MQNSQMHRSKDRQEGVYMCEKEKKQGGYLCLQNSAICLARALIT